MTNYLYKERILGFKHWLFYLRYAWSIISYILLALLFARFFIFVFFVVTDTNTKSFLITLIVIGFIFEVSFFYYYFFYCVSYILKISDRNFIVKRPGFIWPTIYIPISKIKKVEVQEINNFDFWHTTDLIYLAPWWGNWKKRTVLVKQGSVLKIETEDREYVFSTNHPTEVLSILTSMINKK